MHPKIMAPAVRVWQALVAFWCVMLLSLAMPIDPVHAQEAECAEVKIVIEQKLSLERQAFDAHMVIRNGLDGALTNVSVELTFLDQNQQPVVATQDPNAVGATFFYRTDTLTGLTSLQNGSLPAKATGDIRWLMIPSQGAGGNSPEGRMYYIGAKVTYTLNGETTTVDVTPDYVVVRPQPLLVLDYFLPTDVYADDPFTAETEPSEPFTLGVRILNEGMGTSSKTTIESAQPKIVENRQGLLIDFKILGGFVGNELFGKSLLLDFGDIEGRQAKMGRWLMETSLAGRFVEFNATYSHADSLGGAVTSLIKEVRTHRLVHDVLVDYPGHDDVYDFLSEFGAGYKVYDSAGGDAEVIDRSAQASLSAINASNMRLGFAQTRGLVHVKLSDPNRGAKKIARVVRSDGKVLPNQNFWLSKTRNQDLTWSYYVHVFDSDPTGDYLIEFSGAGGASLSGYAYLDANGNGVRDAGEAGDGNSKISLKGVEASGKTVLRDAFTTAEGAFSFVGLEAGRYQLTAQERSGWVDGVWQAGSAGGSASAGLIADIVLGAGVKGTGYALAKRRPDANGNADQADLSIAITADKARLAAGETAHVTIKLGNAGPAAAKTLSAQVAVPAGLTLLGAQADAGSFASGVWTLSALEKGQSATLALQVKADAVSGGQDRSIAWPATVGAATTDPHTGNNNALLGLTVASDQASALELEQIVPAQARVLMLVSCPDASDAAACEDTASSWAQARLADQVHDLLVVKTLTQWQQALRSGLHNVFWLHGGASKLTEQAVGELKAAIRRGATLVVDGDAGTPVDVNLRSLADVMGAEYSHAALGDNQSLRMGQAAGLQATIGAAHALVNLQPQAQVQGSWASGAAAITLASYGQGRAWAMGLDVLSSLQNTTGATQAFWVAHVQERLQALSPQIKVDAVLAGSRLPIETLVRNGASGGDAKEVSLQLSWPNGVAASEVNPAANQATAQSAVWQWRLTAGQEKTALLELDMPLASGSVAVATVLKDSSQAAQDQTRDLSLTVLGLDALVPQVEAALGTSPQDVQAALAAAKAAQAQSDWAQVLIELVKLQTALEAANGHANDLLAVARWMGIAQTQWDGGSANHPASRIEAHTGSGQQTQVGTAFGESLVARVVDAQGQPVLGVTVLFELPAYGASASFVGGGQTAQVVSDADGLASSPALQANGTAGQFQAMASADGVVQGATFELTSLPTGTAGAWRMHVVSGAGQMTQINTAFAAPLVIEVVDPQGNPVAGAWVRFEFAATGASARFAGLSGAPSSTQVQTNAQGRAQSPAFVANGVAGEHVAVARVQGVSGEVSFLLSNSQRAPSLVIETMGGSAQTALAQTAFARALSVNVTDLQGRPVSGARVVFIMPETGAAAVFSGGTKRVEVLTDAGGSALSPSFVATAQVGRFQALATVAGAQQAAVFDLEVLAAGGGTQGAGREFIGTTTTGTGSVRATVTGGGDSCVFNPSATRMIEPQGVWAPLERFLLPHGLFDFELVGCEVGSEVTITTEWPDLRGVSSYLKYGETAQSRGQSIWYAPNNLRIDLLRKTVSYTIRDGGLGDDDLTADGVIRDPGGPVIGGDAIQPVPGLGAWALGALGLMLLVLGARFGGRRAWLPRAKEA